jgi:hypothetical protein
MHSFLEYAGQKQGFRFEDHALGHPQGWSSMGRSTLQRFIGHILGAERKEMLNLHGFDPYRGCAMFAFRSMNPDNFSMESKLSGTISSSSTFMP